MAELFVMRHAKSDWETGVDDFDRPLSKRGHKNAPKMARWLEDTDREPDAILTSAANRARTTAGYVATHFALNAEDVIETPDLYLADVETWMDALVEQSADRLLICGHNPGLDYLVDYLSEEAATTNPGRQTHDDSCHCDLHRSAVAHAFAGHVSFPGTHAPTRATQPDLLAPVPSRSLTVQNERTAPMSLLGSKRLRGGSFYLADDEGGKRRVLS